MRVVLGMVCAFLVFAACDTSEASLEPSVIPTVAPSAVASPMAGPATRVSAAPPASPPAAAGPIDLKPGDVWLAYVWYPGALFLVRPDGSDRHRLPTGISDDPAAVSWSADGERLVFGVRGGTSGNGTIWTSAADGSDAAPLYGAKPGECGDGAFWPVWSPDGSTLAIVCADIIGSDGLTRVSLLDPRTRTRTDLVTFTYPETVDNPPSWSPDGTTLTFEIIHWDPTDTFLDRSVIATVPTAGGEVTQLTDGPLFASHPDWSPDGTKIAFNTYDTGNMHGISEPSNVYTIAPDGSDLRQLSTASTDGTMRLGQPFWSADGSRIWVSAARDFERDSDDQFSNRLGWVDATTGAYTEIGTEGKRFRERPSRR